MSTYAGRDECVNILLDFIAEHEAAGNYNAVIDDAHATDDLSAKTIDQIYVLMAILVGKNRPSSAVGRYQIIRATLQGLQAAAKFSNDTLFTPKLQDELAVTLLTGRGFGKWRLGRLSDEDFAHNLSMEWASLPDPDNGGKSHYDGIGPNHAGTTLGAVYDMLARARQALAGPVVASDPQHIPAPADDDGIEITIAEFTRVATELQTKLKARGRYKHALDGIWGERSQAALRAYHSRVSS